MSESTNDHVTSHDDNLDILQDALAIHLALQQTSMNRYEKAHKQLQNIQVYKRMIEGYRSAIPSALFDEATHCIHAIEEHSKDIMDRMAELVEQDRAFAKKIKDLVRLLKTGP